jgi:L-amino acid N-acyltransferase YncA
MGLTEALLGKERAGTRCLAEIHNNTGKLYHSPDFDKPGASIVSYALATALERGVMRVRDMQVREATAKDLPGIVEIYNSTIPTRLATADTAPIPVEPCRSWLLGRSERRPVWVAEPSSPGSGGIAGWLALSDFNTRPAYHPTAEVAVYVAEGWRGSGVGRLLLAETVRHGPEYGIRTLVAGVFAHNAACLGLFEGFGFSRWARLPRVAELDGVERDLVYLGLRLTQ